MTGCSKGTKTAESVFRSPRARLYNIRNVEVGIIADPEAESGFQFVIAGRAGVAEQHERAGGGVVERIDDELLVGAAAEIIHARDHVGPNLLVQLDVPGQVERRAVEAVVGGHNGPVLVLLLVEVLQNDGRAGWDSLSIVVGDHAREVLGEITGQQWQPIVKEADARSDDRLGIASRENRPSRGVGRTPHARRASARNSARRNQERDWSFKAQWSWANTATSVSSALKTPAP